MVRYAALDVLIPKLAYDSIATGKNIANIPEPLLTRARTLQQDRQRERLRHQSRQAPQTLSSSPNHQAGGLIESSEVRTPSFERSPLLRVSSSGMSVSSRRRHLSRADRRRQRLEEHTGRDSAQGGSWDDDESHHAEDDVVARTDRSEADKAEGGGGEPRGGENALGRNSAWQDRVSFDAIGSRPGVFAREARRRSASVERQRVAAIRHAARSAGMLFDAALLDRASSQASASWGDEAYEPGGAAESWAADAAVAVADGPARGWAAEIRRGMLQGQQPTWRVKGREPPLVGGDARRADRELKSHSLTGSMDSDAELEFGLGSQHRSEAHDEQRGGSGCKQSDAQVGCVGWQDPTLILR